MSAELTRLATALRELRARTGLSLAALSERTAYSKSSWERYLNGKSLAPRQAVQDLCRVADEPEERLLALWEMAESQASGRAAVPAPAAEEPQRRPRAGRPDNGKSRNRAGSLSLVPALVLVCASLAGGMALLLFLVLPDTDPQRDGPRSGSAPYSLGPQCHGAACDGRDPVRLICGVAPAGLATYRTADGARVELRYSEKCGASWARAWGTRVGDRLEVTAGGPTYEVRVGNKADTQTYVYTAMVTAGPGSTIRACFRPAPANTERECFTSRVGHTTAGTANRSSLLRSRW
ncbi:DUF2690 domain-containing protein [Streptomyces sp. NPDC057245]|uniref:helix-turn-helix domain-containing protein n=1 Tax=Streptomyces TaxID=1883 RepID=UPI001C1E117D|nr:XRE family transcriptional regulator [Streptomyces sp. A108]MBU6532866.1 DUF2690 domain-containing protein [Streptomyces sp. A108]